MAIVVLESTSHTLSIPSSDLTKKLCWLTIFSCIGVIIRVYTTFTATILPGIIYPQIIGSFLIGIFYSNKFFESHPNLKFGLSTGLCGSITTFSSFILETYLYFQTNIWNGLILIGLVVGLSYGSFKIGQHIGSLDIFQIDYNIPSNDVFLIIITFIVYVLVLLWFIFSLSFQSLSTLIGPFGTFLRFYLSNFNGQYQDFPIGTFAANIVGTILICIFYIIQFEISSSATCLFFQACIIGFCGCLSTISTFIVEIHTLPRQKAYQYCLISIASGVLVALIIVGIWQSTTQSRGRCF
ncbi:CrcB-like protein-domain-containing protein [Globomyces pollinis-pini]|nr:CrcB-like protein-domain-containing protein [Globomyces pollinis-pini]